jgi:formyl-CoA transferase/CoA:oxalate CoA-transferase
VPNTSKPDARNDPPLSGIRVLDLTRVLAGPFATCILADLGAEVIKVERPGLGDDVRNVPPFYPGRESHYFIALNRNKKSITIDLKKNLGRELLLELAAHSDVVIENFRPQVLDRLGIGYESLTARQPSIILCSISGFGPDGPLSNAPSFDLVTQALSGVMSINGEPSGPPTKLGLPIGDLSGGLWSAIAILAALQRRQNDKRPQHIEMSLLDGLIGLLGYLGQMALLTGESPGRVGSGHHSIVPYGLYQAADGYIVLALHVGNFWQRFCSAVDHEGLAEDDKFRTSALRYENREDLQELVRDIIKRKGVAEWQRIFNEADIPHAPVLDTVEALNQDQVNFRNVLVPMDHPTAGHLMVVRSPIRFKEDDLSQSAVASPLLGQHTHEVLQSVLDKTTSDIELLMREQVI